jgi:hypothetical protein
MKEWLHSLLFEYDSFGGMIFNYFIILFVYLFCWFWISMILNVIISSLIDFKKKREEIKYGYNVKRDIKYDNLYKKIEGIIEIPLLFPGMIIKYIQELIEDKLNVDLKKNKLLIQWFIGFIIITSVWINWTDPFNDFMLLTKGIEVDGKITKSKQESEIVENNDGRSRSKEFNFIYSYDYETKERYTLTNTEEVKGEEPEEFYTLEDEPIEVKVTYLESNPTYSRVLKYTTNNKNLYEWFRYTILYYFITITIWSYFMYSKKRDNND